MNNEAISLETWILLHTCYREVFSAPVKVESLKQWLGVSESSIDSTIEDLCIKKLIFLKDGFIVRFGNEHIIDKQPKKQLETKRLMAKGHGFLKFLGRLWFIKFIGISGSVAAENPPLLDNRKYWYELDLDIFIVATKNTMWLFLLIERLITNLNVMLYNGYFYCFNYVTDESFLEITNRNFFTATELVNLKTLVDKGYIDELESKNEWYRRYYPGMIKQSGEHSPRSKPSLISRFFWVPNFLCFSLFCLGRAIKRRNFNLLGELSTKFNPGNKCNFRRMTNSEGGYQELIKERFYHLLRDSYPSCFSPDIVEFLFPKNSSFKIDEEDPMFLDYKKYFKRYSVTGHV